MTERSKLNKRFFVFMIPAFVLWLISQYFFPAFATDQLNIVVPFLIETKGWTPLMITNANTYGRIANIPFTFLVGTLIIKWGAKRVFCLSMIMYGISELLVAWSLNYAVFFVGMFLIPIIGIGVLMSTFALVNQWFRKWRGTALGIVTMVSPLASATVISYMSNGVVTMGFFTTFAILAVIVALAGVVGFAIIRNTPEEYGCYPDGALEAPPPEVLVDAEGVDRIKIKHILKYKESWCHILTFGFMLFCLAAYPAFFLMRFEQLGFTPPQAMAFIFCFSIFGAVLSLFSGFIDDKLGTRRATIMMCSLMFLGTIGLSFGSAEAPWLIWIGIVALGGNVGAAPNLGPSMVVYLFGRKAFNRVYRLLNTGMYIIPAFAIGFVSSFLERDGHFANAYRVMIGVGAIVLIGSILMNKKRDLTADVKAEENKKEAAAQ
ncbi:MAG: MFS transporter [Oscillospiraceae bacterium]|nr:MFS transporter [Oscillospiraceae bacterium]